MKFSRTASNDHPVGRASSRAGSSVASPHQYGFTMVEIAISLAIIGIALVAIIGVLPLGMNVQKDNREETLINQDATVFMEAIRGGASSPYGADLTNYVYEISYAQYNSANGNLASSNNFGSSYLTNNARIIGLLSNPKYFNGTSNHIVAYVRSISGPAVEKPPQDNQLVTGDSFSYKVICDNVPVAVDTNVFNSLYNAQLTNNLHELRLTFLWPLLPSGNTGSGRQTFRTLIAGQLVPDANNTNLYFFQSQIFTNVSAP
jgi:prepilin-type N-terminal cleavage/methylation domain-containing protein